MFRRMYLTIVGMLVVSTGVLLLLLGGAVYRELQTELTHEGQSVLNLEAKDVVNMVKDTLSGHTAYNRDLRGTQDQNVYFYAILPDRTLTSYRQPVPLSKLKQELPRDGFSELFSASSPYLAYAFTTQIDGEALHAYLYTSMSQENSMQRHVLHLMWEVGSIGFFLALLGNLALAQRLMRPTYRAWVAYRRTVLELSHELQTPLATVNAMMTSRNVDAETAADVRQEISRASKMVADMLFLSRLRSGFSEQPTSPVAVSDITEEVAERFRIPGLCQGIKLTGSAVPGLFVETSPDKWERLVSTLFKNVIDHAATPSIAKWSLVSEGRYVVLTVKNDCVEPQMERPLSTMERGVGLQIVRNLVQNMRGNVEIKSREQQFFVCARIPQRRRYW